MKVIYKNGKPSGAQASELPLRSVFRAKNPCRDGYAVFLRTYSGVVNLEDPEQTWDTHSVRFNEVTILQNVELVIKD